MATILAPHYRENYEALALEPVVIAMARDTIEKDIPFKLTHDNSATPTFQFMQLASRGYWAEIGRGNATVEPGSIGAVAEAILIARRRLLDAQEVSR